MAARLFHWYEGYSTPVAEGPPPAVPPAGEVALCGHVREEGLSDEAKDMRIVDQSSCMRCVRLRLGKVAEDFTDDELRQELGEGQNPDPSRRPLPGHGIRGPGPEGGLR